MSPGLFRRATLLGLAFGASVLGASGARATDRALIMTISNYEGVPALPGVRIDADNAKKILSGIGFGTDDLRIVDEKQLTLDGMRQVLAKLAKDTQEGDRVFVYFSGHGTSYAAGSRCEQALVTRDLKALAARDLLHYFTALRDSTARVIVILDSCFSGGVAQAVDEPGRVARAISLRTPKYAKIADTSTDCATPVNVTAAELQAMRSTKGAVNLDRNYVVVAAARDNEVAFDDGAKGGVATSAIVQCLTDPAADTDHSGSVSFGELAGCAQAKINESNPGSDTLRQHIVVSGNDGMPVAAAEADADAPTSPLATLQDMLQAADARFDVQAAPTAKVLRIKKREGFKLKITSARDGYVYVLYVGSDQHEFLKLYPSPAAEPNHVRAGVPFAIDRVWHSEGPAGIDHLLVLVTPQPRDFSTVFGQQAAAPPTYHSSSGLQDAVGVCRNLSSETCPDGTSRNLSGDSPAPGTGTGYGATMLSIEERDQ